jgi:hypothetical protein
MIKKVYVRAELLLHNKTMEKEQFPNSEVLLINDLKILNG